ncbi:hypothetical protein BGZ81_002510 [Podila clonocystis]|nr:hypothetical protein BGZ81_002510 [Podila clonocystis]
MALPACRPVANLERYFLGLGNAHMYYNVAMGIRLQFQSHPEAHGPGPKELPRSKDQWLALLTPALATVVQRHPLMSTYIAGHLTATPTFQAMSSIDLSKIIAVDSIQQSMDIAKFLEMEHDKPFDLGDHQVPLWRIMVVHITDDDTFYLLYIFHHSLCDGRSSAAFTEQLLAELNHIIKNKTTSAPLPPSKRNNPWTITCPNRTPLPLALEQRVDCTPSLKTRVRHFLYQVIMPAWLKKALEPQFWAGEFPATASNETQLGIVVLTPEETSQLIAAARRKHTTVNSVLFTSFLFAIKAVFLSSSHGDNKDAKKGATTTTQDLFSASTVACPRSSQLFSSPVEHSEHVLCIADLWTHGHAVELETEFWSFTREYHAQVVRHVRTPRKLQRLLENYGTLRYMPGSPEGYEKALQQRYVRQQYGREGTMRTSNIGVGWKQENGGDDKLVFKVLHPLFTMSAVTMGPVFTFCVATGEGGSLVVSNTWQRGAVRSRGQADRVLREFRKVVGEACHEGRESYLFRDVLLSC